MKIYDISWPIFQGMTAYKNRHEVAINHTRNHEEHGMRSSVITIGSHSGTHIDAPSHFINGGKNIEELSPLCCVGPAQVIDMTAVDDVIDLHHIEPLSFEKGMMVLFKTKNSQRDVMAPFDPEFVYINGPASKLLIQKGARAVGIDYLGIERDQPEHETHHAFLQHDIPIIEGLRLGHVDAGTYFLWCLPLSVIGAEAAPARALLLEE